MDDDAVPVTPSAVAPELDLLHQRLELSERQIRELRSRLEAIATGNKLRPDNFAQPVGPSQGGNGVVGSILGGVSLWKNNSGGTRSQGEVVISDGDRFFTRTTDQQDRLTIGILDDDAVAAGVSARVRHLGYQSKVLVQGAVVANDYLRPSTTIGRAEDAGTDVAQGVFGIALTAFAGPGAGQVSAFIFPVSSGSGAAQDSHDHVITETPTGTINGINAAFTLASNPDTGTLEVWKNGLHQQEGGANDYTLSGAIITFNAGNIPIAGDVLLANYQQLGDGAHTHIENETPTGTINGINAAFTLAGAPDTSKLNLYKNGLHQRPGAGNDYTITGATITFEAGNIPIAGDILLASYVQTGGGGHDHIVNETPAGLVNGSNTTFITAHTPNSSTLEVWKNGLHQRSGAGNDYTISADTITYLTAPLTGDILLVDYDVTASGAAPDSAKYVVTKSDGTLTAEVVRQFLGNFFEETYPSSANALDDEFDDTSGNSGLVNGLNAKWTVRNAAGSPSASALTETFLKQGFLDLATPNSNGGTQNIEQTISGDWTVETVVSIDGTGTAIYAGLICITNSSSVAYKLGVLWNANVFDIYAQKLTLPNTFIADLFAAQLIGNTKGWLRFSYVDSTKALSIFYSSDGIGWVLLVTITTSASIDRVGLFIGNDLGSGAAYFDYFRRTA